MPPSKYTPEERLIRKRNAARLRQRRCRARKRLSKLQEGKASPVTAPSSPLKKRPVPPFITTKTPVSFLSEPPKIHSGTVSPDAWIDLAVQPSLSSKGLDCSSSRSFDNLSQEQTPSAAKTDISSLSTSSTRSSFETSGSSPSISPPPEEGTVAEQQEEVFAVDAMLSLRQASSDELDPPHLSKPVARHGTMMWEKPWQTGWCPIPTQAQVQKGEFVLLYVPRFPPRAA